MYYTVTFHTQLGKGGHALTILEDELEDRYPTEDGADETLTLTRRTLMWQLRNAYRAGATRTRTDRELAALGPDMRDAIRPAEERMDDILVGRTL